MLEAEAGCVQRLPVELQERSPCPLAQPPRTGLETAAVDGIAEYRVPNLRKMHADLMRAARLEREFRKARDRNTGFISEDLEQRVVRDGVARLGRLRDRHARAVVAAPRDRCIDGTARTVRRDGAGTTVTDGPYAESVEQLGGFYLVETDDLDDLLEICGLLAGPDGGVEVRATVEHG